MPDANIIASRTIIIVYYLELSSGIGHNRPVASLAEGVVRYMPSPFYTASVVLFQLHGCVVSHMQVLATPLQVCIILNTTSVAIVLVLTEQKCFSVCRYRVIESSSLVSVLFREVFSHPYIFFHFTSKCLLCYSYMLTNNNPYTKFYEV